MRFRKVRKSQYVANKHLRPLRFFSAPSAVYILFWLTIAKCDIITHRAYGCAVGDL